jgi:hypothetical protein
MRKVYGPQTEQEVWKMTTSHKLMQVYKTPDLAADIKGLSLEWLEYLVRMGERRVSMNIFESKLVCRRNAGRPRLRWLKNIGKD